MLLAHHRTRIGKLREPTPSDPWRVLVSGCLAGLPCGVDGTDNGLGNVLAELLALRSVRVLPFCPEQHALGTPRTTPDIHGGDGVDVLAGMALVLDEFGTDLTAQMVTGARAMLAFARESGAELSILTDMSAACGSQVISDGSRVLAARKYQRGVGIATALLLEAGIPCVSQRDHHTLALLRERLDPGYARASALCDHHEQPWVVEHLVGKHPRA